MYLTDPYRWRTAKAYWQTEFWGKYMHAAAPFARMTGDRRLAATIEAAVANLLPSQLPDGYLGNYCEEARCGRGWDVWGCKYTMLGLLFHYDLTGAKPSLDAAARLCDYLRGVFGPGKKDIVLSGQYKGMPSCSVLEPVVWLYKRTKHPEHLAFAKYIVSQMDEHPDGPHLIRDAGVPVAARTADAKPGYEGQNPGLKAYEMMSCYQGLLEYYEVTGDRRCLDAAVKTAESIVATEVNICGGSTCVEHWYTGALRQNRPYMRQQETCVLTTWMRLCEKLLTLTGESRWADELEKTFYNAYLGALHPDGSKFATYSPLCGFRSFGQYHCKMHTNCCNANGPRGFVVVLNAFLQARGKEVFLNFYNSGKTAIALPDTGTKVTFETFTLYPERGTVEIWNRTEKPTEFTLNLRIPAWSEKTSVKLNGKPVADVKPGGYLSEAQRQAGGGREARRLSFPRPHVEDGRRARDRFRHDLPRARAGRLRGVHHGTDRPRARHAVPRRGHRRVRAHQGVQAQWARARRAARARPFGEHVDELGAAAPDGRAPREHGEAPAGRRALLRLRLGRRHVGFLVQLPRVAAARVLQAAPTALFFRNPLTARIKERRICFVKSS